MSTPKIQVFNPIKEEVDGKKARRVIWSTKSLELAIQGIEKGQGLVANPFYENNVMILKADLVFERTEEEMHEWIRCKNDIIYFAERYCKLMTPKGIQNIILRDYQRDYLKHLEKNRLSIFLSCRQSGKTTTSAIFMLHYILFNVDKSALVVGNKYKTAKDILDKLKQIFYEIPYFLKPGIYKWNEGEIVLDNGCRCLAEATTQNSGIGFTFHCVLADEFAHIPKNILEPFYNNLFPTIVAGQARFIISSTQNGHNLFETLYKSAVSGESQYAPFCVDWYQVPEWDPTKQMWVERDEAWRKQQVANMGGEARFNKQFGTVFVGDSPTLIPGIVIERIRDHVKIFQRVEMLGVSHQECWWWDPDLDLSTLRKKFIIITVDLAEGIGGDYTVFLVSELLPESSILQLGYFRSNEISRNNASILLKEFVRQYCDINHILVSLEWNMYGESFYRSLIEMEDWDESILTRYYGKDNTSMTPGIKFNGSNKHYFCSVFRDSVINGKFSVTDVVLLGEMECFEERSPGRFCASTGHDDLMMAAIQTECVKTTINFKFMSDMCDESASQPTEQPQK